MVSHPAIAELERQIAAAARRPDRFLPPYPAVALQVQQAVAKGDLGAGEVARLIEADAALAADVLRCANSAFYGRGAPVSSLPRAIARIGERQVLRLAFTCVLAARAHAGGLLGPVRRRLWLESVASAALAGELARFRGLDSDEAFTAGLLHDFGKLVAVWHLEALLDAGPRVTAPLAAWLEVLERQHVALGVALARSWDLPPTLEAAIAEHHAAGPAAPVDTVIGVVQAADRVVALLLRDVGVQPTDLASVAELRGAERLALGPVIERIPELIASFEPASSTRPSLRSVVEDEPPRATDPLAPFPVALHLGGRELACRATAVAPQALVVAAPGPVPLHKLLQATVARDAEPFGMWSLPSRAAPCAQGFDVALSPFALDAQMRARWNRLLLACRLAGAKLQPAK